MKWCSVQKVLRQSVLILLKIKEIDMFSWSYFVYVLHYFNTEPC